VVNGIRVKEARIEPDTLLYSWGNANEGKLGISDDYVSEFYADNLHQFYINDKIENEIID